MEYSIPVNEQINDITTIINEDDSISIEDDIPLAPPILYRQNGYIIE
jgi:hypothetical protein